MNAKKENTKMTEQTMNDETEDVVDARPAPGEATEESAAPGGVTTGDAPDEQDELDETTKAGREAAKYRRRLRETEAERDALATRVEAMQSADAERLAATHLHKPAALWAAGTTLPDLLDEDGALDAEKVREAATKAREDLGLTPPRRNHVPGEGTNPHPGSAGRRMEDVIRGR